jgi:hypothetical protein
MYNINSQYKSIPIMLYNHLINNKYILLIIKLETIVKNYIHLILIDNNINKINPLIMIIQWDTNNLHLIFKTIHLNIILWEELRVINCSHVSKMILWKDNIYWIVVISNRNRIPLMKGKQIIKALKEWSNQMIRKANKRNGLHWEDCSGESMKMN